MPSTRPTYNPFKVINETSMGDTKEEVERKRMSAEQAKRRKQAEKVKSRDVKSKSWFDYIGAPLKYVGDYMRGK